MGQLKGKVRAPTKNPKWVGHIFILLSVQIVRNKMILKVIENQCNNTVLRMALKSIYGSPTGKAHI